MMNFINPKTNFGFKRIFGSEQSKDILISLLNGLLYQGEPTIEDLEILDPYQSPKLLGGKDTYLDVKARLQDGTLVIIEMQVLNLAGFEKRILYNAAKGYVLQLEAEKSYRTLLPVIALTITDFKLLDEQEIAEPISQFVFKHQTKDFFYPINDITLVFVELPKFRKGLDELETLAEQWMAFFQYARTLREVPEPMAEIPALRHAFEVANQAILSVEELDVLEKQEAFMLDTRMTMELTRQKLEQSREEGYQQGIVATAQRMLQQFDDATISQITGLDIETIRMLRSGKEPFL